VSELSGAVVGQVCRFHRRVNRSHARTAVAPPITIIVRAARGHSTDTCKERICSRLDYARQGGRLLVVEPFGTEDEWARSQTAAPLAQVKAAGDDFTCAPFGKGKVLRLKAEAVSARRST
jgi:hypothetical protein